MLATTTAFTQMVEGVEQTRHYAIKIALPGGIYPDVTLAASAVSVDEQLTTDLPEGTRLLEGSPSAGATFTLAGLVDKTDETKTAEWLFGPYQTTSPLYRQDAFRSLVTIDLGLLPDGAGGTAQVLRKFTGYVDSYNVNPDGGVEFTCIDKRSDLRNSPSVPAVVTAPPYNAGLTSEFAIDALLRQSTNGALSSWPKQRAQCVLAAGMRSSVWPEVGALNTSTPIYTAPTFQPGIYGTAFADRSSGLSAAAYTLSRAVTTVLTVEFLGSSLTNASAAVSVGFDNTGAENVEVGVGVSAASITDSSTGNVWSIAIPSATSHFVTARMNLASVGSGTSSGSLIVDGITYALSPQTTGTSTRAHASWTYCEVSALSNIILGGQAGIEAVQVTTETAPVTSYPFTPGAVLNPSLNSLEVVPAVEGDPFQAIQQIAQAELGTAGFDESGVFRFYNRNTLRAGAVARTITSSASLKSLGLQQSAASVVNRAQIGYTGWNFATTASTVYSIDTAKRIARGQTENIIVNLDNYVAQLSTTIAKLPNSSSDTTNSWYRASVDQAGTREHPGLTFTVSQTGANTITIAATNNSTQDAWLVSPANYTDLTAGTPLLRLGGLLVTPDTELSADYQYPPAVDGGAAASRFQEVVYEQTGNPWSQDAGSANQLAQDIVGESCNPIPNLVNVDIVPDPRLQLGDRVRIVDPDETGIDEYALIFGISTSFTANDAGDADYTMSIDARAITRPGGTILGVSGRSELASTTYI